MTFDEVLDQVRDLLQSKGRMVYRALKRRFELDDEYLEDLKAELIKAEGVAADENGEVLVWVGKGINGETDKQINGEGEKAKGRKGETEVVSSQLPVLSSPQPPSPPTPNVELRTFQPLDAGHRTPDARQSAAERRQLTVMFCDLVGSTALSQQLDPEKYREVVQSYQETCTAVIRRYDGHIAQHLGDGLLIYFGYPVAHEDDAARAVRAGLEIVKALRVQVPSPLVEAPFFSPSPCQGEGSTSRASAGEGSVVAQPHDSPHPNPLPGEKRELRVRLGIHTGLVVIGEIGSSEKRELLALGETPNLAARIQGQANPNEVVISAATYRLVEGLFACENRGQPELKGVTTPLPLYRIVRESDAQSRFDVAVQAGLTPLVGRDEELALLRRRWGQATDSEGQVVLLSGEAGIGKSRLVQELKGQVAQDNAVRIEFRCSPYHQNSALYPIIEHVQQVLHFTPSDTPHAKLQKLQQTLTRYRFSQPDTVPLLAALLSLPHPEVASLNLTPQQQKQQTLDAVVHWLFEEAEHAPVYTIWEDLHWADPSTLEFLALCLNQVPTARMLMLLTFRPEFTPGWASRSHISHLVLSRLGRKQTSTIVEQITGEKMLPLEVLQQIVAKTDGVPLFVEELTKSVVESVGVHDRAPLQSLAIPATLQDALMARLDRLGSAKEVAQHGAVVGRELTYDLLRVVSPLPEAALQQELTKLVAAELLYQRGRPPQATYFFKHALVQEAAYQSLLKSKRQQLHQQVAQVLVERFVGLTEAQPELVAHHYTEAGLGAQAIPYWQGAGKRAVQRSANAEAITHLTKGLELLKTLPDTPERVQQELTSQITLGTPLMATKGFSAPEVERAYARALELCRRVGETPQLFRVLFGLHLFYIVRGKHATAHELAEQLLTLAQRLQDQTLLLQAHYALSGVLFYLGEFVSARAQLEQGIALYNPQQHNSHVSGTPTDVGVGFRGYAGWVLWFLGYPDQALKMSFQALTLAHELAHPFILAAGLHFVAQLHQIRRDEQLTRERAEESVTLSAKQGFPQFLAIDTMLWGWALASLGQEEKGIAQMHEGLAAFLATGAEFAQPFFLAQLADVCGKARQTKEGLAALAEAMAKVNKTGEQFYEAELYRLKGELTLQKLSVPSPQPLTSSTQEVEREAEECFLNAIEIAQKQQAKSLELRATVSLARLWQQQGKLTEAHQMLSEVYNWFTEGFDTKDLQEAKVLLEELTRG